LSAARAPWRLARRLLLSGAWRALRLADIVLIERPRGFPRRAASAVWLEDVGFAQEDRRSYAPSPWGVLARMLPPGRVSADDVFVDFGCGMGRVVLEAAEHYPFKRVVGVDIVPGFARAAEWLLRRNAHRLRASDWQIVTADVARYRIPDDVTVAYFYDPFAGELFDSVMAQLERSVARNPRRVTVLYLTPREASRLSRLDGLVVTRRGTTGLLSAGARYDYLVAELRPPAGAGAGSRDAS
jgi:SAM-dependent methyltransferase